MRSIKANLKDIITICVIPFIMLIIINVMHRLSEIIEANTNAVNGSYTGICLVIANIVCIGLFLYLYMSRKWNYRFDSLNIQTKMNVHRTFTLHALATTKSTGTAKTPFLCFLLFIIIILLGVFLQAAVSSILNIISFAKPELMEDYFHMVKDSFDISRGAATVISTTILAPVAEELAFRGYGMSVAAGMIHVKKGEDGIKALIRTYFPCIIIISLLFAISHGNPIQAVYAIIMGIILSCLTVLSSSIIPSTALHITINSSAYLLPGILFKTKEMTIITLIISLICSVIFIYFTFLIFSKNSDNK